MASIEPPTKRARIMAPKGSALNNPFRKLGAGVNGIILSMTKKERETPRLLKGSRLKRVANGSGVQVRDVNALLKQFGQMQKMMKMMNGGKGRKMMKAMKPQMAENGGQMPGLPGM